MSAEEKQEKKQDGASSLQIPKIIFQTYRAKHSENAAKAMKKVKDLNPDWEYRFYDDTKARELIATHFPASTLEAYDSLIPGAFKADLWRYCALYVYGGMYLDHKIVILMPLSTWIRPQDTYIVGRGGRLDDRQTGTDSPREAFQAVLAFAKGHKILKTAIDMIVENVRKQFYGTNCRDVTGPRLLARAFMTHDRPILTSGLFADHQILRHDKDHYAIFQIPEPPSKPIQVLVTGYKNYWSQTTERPMAYQLLWRKRQIYRVDKKSKSSVVSARVRLRLRYPSRVR